mgnify:CR=1 FL=1
MFNFKIIDMPDGNQIIDMSLKTPYDTLTPIEMIEYIEVDKSLVIMACMEKKRLKEAEHQRKLARNPLYRLACLCGIV